MPQVRKNICRSASKGSFSCVRFEIRHSLELNKEDKEMYETCDIVIEMIDGGFWEIFSKNVAWINQLAEKFQNIEFLTSDFQNKKPV